MSCVADFYLAAGDLEPKLVVTAKDSNGDAVDLTGATIGFELFTSSMDPVALSGTASIVGTATQGKMQYAWASGDTDTSGDYLGRFKVTKLSRTQTVPTHIHAYLKIKIWP